MIEIKVYTETGVDLWQAGNRKLFDGEVGPIGLAPAAGVLGGDAEVIGAGGKSLSDMMGTNSCVTCSSLLEESGVIDFFDPGGISNGHLGLLNVSFL